MLAGRALAAAEAAHPGLPGAWCTLAADLAGRAGDAARAGALLLEAGRRDLAAGALASAEHTLTRARDLVGPALQTSVDEALTEVFAMSGQVDRAIETGRMLLARLGPPSPRAAHLHLEIARAAIAGARWAEAAASIEVARESAGADAAQIDACAAQVAAGRGRLEEADRLARAALRAAEGEEAPKGPARGGVRGPRGDRPGRQAARPGGGRAGVRPGGGPGRRARAAVVAAAGPARAGHHRPAQDRERGPARAGARAGRGPGRAGPDRDPRPADRRRAEQAVPRGRGPGGGPAVGGRVPPLPPGHAADGADLRGHRARHPRRGRPDGGPDRRGGRARPRRPGRARLRLGALPGHVLAAGRRSRRGARADDDRGRAAAEFPGDDRAAVPRALAAARRAARPGPRSQRRGPGAGRPRHPAPGGRRPARLRRCGLRRPPGPAAAAEAAFAAADRQMGPLVAWYRQYARRLAAEAALADGGASRSPGCGKPPRTSPRAATTGWRPPAGPCCARPARRCRARPATGTCRARCARWA